MAKQIDVLADWATATATYGNTALKPSSAKRQAGWVGGATPDVPPAPHVNWLHKTAYENVAWLIDNAYFSDVARWEYTPLTGTFPATASGRFQIGYAVANDPGSAGNHIAWDGASAFMVTGSSVATAPAGATSFVLVSRDVGRSFQLNIPAALSGTRIGGVTYDGINSRFVVMTTVLSNQHCAVKYTSDYGATWSSTEISGSNVDSMKAISWWKEAGRYVGIGFFNNVMVFVSASGSIAGPWTQSTMTASEFYNGNQPVMNNRYFMYSAKVFSTSQAVLYYIPLGGTSVSRVLCNTTPLNVLGAVNLHYLPHNNTFVISASGSFIVLDGATGVPSTVAHWTSVVPSAVGNSMPGAAAFNAVDWLQWDARRSLFYAHVPSNTGGIPSVAGMWTAPSLVGPWRQLPAYPGGGNGLIKVLGSNYLNDYFVDVDPLSFIQAGAPDASIQALAKRSFPPLY